MAKGVVVYAAALAIVVAGCQEENNYGLISAEGTYPYSYFIVGGELLVKDGYDFVAQFETDEYAALAREVESLPGYMQPELLQLPVIQTVVPGDKNILIFERVEKHFEGILVKRLAIECGALRDTLRYPNDFRGYYMIDGWEWPPEICAIAKGEIVVECFAQLTGSLSGTLSVKASDTTWSDGKPRTTEHNISGRFSIREKGSTLFLSIPAREGYGSR